jgi:hypothetical protein
VLFMTLPAKNRNPCKTEVQSTAVPAFGKGGRGSFNRHQSCHLTQEYEQAQLPGACPLNCSEPHPAADRDAVNFTFRSAHMPCGGLGLSSN